MNGIDKVACLDALQIDPGLAPPHFVTPPSPSLLAHPDRTVLLAVFGVQERAYGCTRANHWEHIVKIVQKHYKVITYVLEMVPRDGLVDGVVTQSLPCTTYSPHDVCETVGAEWVDQRVREGCIGLNCTFSVIRMRKKILRYDNKTIHHAYRQLFSEFLVSEFVRKHAPGVALVVAVGNDYYFQKGMSDDDVLHASRGDDNTFYTSDCYNTGGYTNGFYMGKPRAIIIGMGRWSVISRFSSPPMTYEEQLMMGLRILNLTRGVMGNHRNWDASCFLKIRHNGHLNRKGFLDESSKNCIMQQTGVLL